MNGGFLRMKVSRKSGVESLKSNTGAFLLMALDGITFDIIFNIVGIKAWPRMPTSADT
jgi:hypothetical protein